MSVNGKRCECDRDPAQSIEKIGNDKESTIVNDSLSGPPVKLRSDFFNTTPSPERAGLVADSLGLRSRLICAEFGPISW